MSTEMIFPIALFFATFLSSLVAGLLFVFAIVVMPGIKQLNHREFIRAFQVIDGVIQKNHPLFILVWVGSVIAVIAAAVLGVGQLAGVERWLMLLATLAYLFGVQLPTAIVNVPLNNQLQTLNVETMAQAGQAAARQAFEPRWNQWNAIRTIIASLVSAQLMVLLLML